MVTTLFFILWGILSGIYVDDISPDPSTICPPGELIEPCTCFKGCPVCPALVECSGITNLNQLEEVSSKSSDWSFWNFLITKSTLMYLPFSFIDRKRVRNLYLRDNVMAALFDRTPPPTNVLQELELTNVFLQRGMRWDVFESLVNLKELTITGFQIRKMDQAFVNYFPQGLLGLYFTDTKTKTLGDTTFAKLTNLSRIAIRNSPVKILKRSMFPAESQLIAMNFSQTDIESLPDDIFTNMPDLNVVDISGAKLNSLPEAVFGEALPRLNLLWLEGDPLNCNCQMKWIPKVESLPFRLKANCSEPKPLEGLSISDLKESHFYHCE